VPQKAPDGAITRSESAISLLERIRLITNEWVRPGYIRGQNTHNVSATISVKEHEWDEVFNWMWENRGVYNGLSVLPYAEHTYIQSPFEDCSEEVYMNMMSSIGRLDLDHIREYSDNTNLVGELACAGGSCAVSYL
jgi:ribonucleoside-diphosphate reductase alpha chain